MGDSDLARPGNSAAADTGAVQSKPRHEKNTFKKPTGFECWQINLHKSKAASYTLGNDTKRIKSGIILAQEPWTYGDRLRGKVQGWKPFQSNKRGERPRACVYTTPDLNCQLLPMWSDRDVVSVRIKNVCREGDNVIFVSAYMDGEANIPPPMVKEIVARAETERTPLIIATDANAHHTLWGSSNINKRGEDLLEFCAQSNLKVCNVGSKPTFRNRIREEVLDLTLANQYAWEMVKGWYVSDVPSLSDHMTIRFSVDSNIVRKPQMVRNIRRTCWDKYEDELDRRINERDWKLDVSSIEDIEKLAIDVQNVICESYESACPLRKVSHKRNNDWWTPELDALKKEARQTERRATRSKNDDDAWDLKARSQAKYKNAIRKAKRAGWRRYTETMEGYTPTARLVKALRKTEAADISSVYTSDGVLTKTPKETLNCLLDTLSPGSREVGERNPVQTTHVSLNPLEEEIVSSICSEERMETAINEFEPFKAAGKDGIYLVLLQKGWNKLKDIYKALFSGCLTYGYVPRHWKEGRGVFLPKAGKASYLEVKSFRMITLTSFQLKWLERLILYHLNNDEEIQSKLSKSQYGFRSGVSTETALHEFVLRIEKGMAGKKMVLGAFLDIEGAFDNVAFSSVARSLESLGVPGVLRHWIENMLVDRVIQVELAGDTVEREITKGNPQGGILSPFLWNSVVNSLLVQLKREGFYSQAYADDLALLISGSDARWVRSRAQRALDIAVEWARINELKFSSKKTEIVLFTRKRKSTMGNLFMNGQELKFSTEAKLLGVTLDSKLTWKTHITQTAAKATAVLMQCRQAVGKRWGLKPQIMKWIYTAMVRPIMTYACISWIGGVHKKYLEAHLNKVQRLALLMISSAFPSTPTGALEMLMGIMPIKEFITAEAVRASYRIDRAGLWTDKVVGTTGKTRSHVDICNDARRHLPIVSMPADFIPKRRVFERNFKCLILDRPGAISFERHLDKRIIKCYTDGSKLDGRIGAGIRIVYQNESDCDENFFYLGKLSTVFQAEVFAIYQAVKALRGEGVTDQEIVILSDSQAAIKALQNTLIRSRTVLDCVQELNLLGSVNRITITWIPGHEGVAGNEAADVLAKEGSLFIQEGPEPFIPVPYASCLIQLKEMGLNRWKEAWYERSDCARTKEHVGWASRRLVSKILGLHRTQLNQIIQILTGHCRLMKHMRTTGRANTSFCPKCGSEEETPEHHVSRCDFYQDIRQRFFGSEHVSIRKLMDNMNVRRLIGFLQQAGRLAEHDQRL